MRPGILLALIVALSSASYAGPSTTDRRDKALKEIKACLHRNYVPSRECKNLNENVQTLVDVYWQGDTTVLPILLRFTYLDDFYSTALIADPNNFLATVSQLPEPNQHVVALSVAGGTYGVTSTRFEAIRSTLLDVPHSSPNYQLARTCLLTLETQNASLLVDYFPPQTFTGRASDLRVHWFSRELYLLEEKPMWPPASADARIYRITVLPAFSAPVSVTVSVLPDGAGQTTFRTLDSQGQQSTADDKLTASW